MSRFDQPESLRMYAEMYGDVHRPVAERRTAEDRDPLRHSTGTSDFLVPSAAHGSKPVPRWRAPVDVSPLPPGLIATSRDIEKYASFRREQDLLVDTAMRLAEKAQREADESRTALAQASPEHANDLRDAAPAMPPKTAAEESERAVNARNLLLALNLGYEVTTAAAGGYMRGAVGAMGGSVPETVFQVTRCGLVQAVGDLRCLEGVAYQAVRDARVKAAQLERLKAQPARPFVTVAAVQVVGPGEEFATQAEIAQAAQRAELKAEILRELRGEAA